MTLEEQKGYLKRHPKSKRKITAKPEKGERKKTDKKTQTKKTVKKVRPTKTTRAKKKLEQKKLKTKKTQDKKMPKGTPTNYDDLISNLISTAKGGDRVVYNGKTIWTGLGNRSGLHDYAQTAINKKWDESGARFEKKIEELAKQKGATFQTQMFRNIDRDRGRWTETATLESKGFEEASAKEPKKKVERIPIKSMYKKEYKPDDNAKIRIAEQMMDNLQESRSDYLQADQIRIADATATHLGLDRDKVGDSLIDSKSGFGFIKFSPESAKLMKKFFNKDVSDNISNTLTVAKETIDVVDGLIEGAIESGWSPSDVVKSVAAGVQKYGWDEKTAKEFLLDRQMVDANYNDVSESTIKRLIKKHF